MNIQKVFLEVSNKEFQKVASFSMVIKSNKRTIDSIAPKAWEIAKQTNLTYPEAHKIFIDYFRQNSKSMENISVEEVLEYYNNKDAK